MSRRARWAPQTRPRYVGAVYRSIPHDSKTGPLDGSYARDNGGRWNPPGSFSALYTSCSVQAAIAFLREHYRDEALQPWEQPEDKQRDLYTLHVEQDYLVDAVAPEGLAGLGLPTGYPRGISHKTTQPIGQRLYDEHHPGIWCKCAPDPHVQEVVLFLDHAAPIRVGSQPPRRLREWFPVPES
jgi:RES domain